jgi:hypothetical protein
VTFQFVAWSRRGASAEHSVGTVDASARRIVTATTVVTAERDGAPPHTDEVASPPLALLGPGDVVGLDPAQIVRRVPRPDDHNFEPNYLAAIEFAHPDIPWLFSPVAEAGAGVAMPWLMLVVVDVEPGHEQAQLTVHPGAPNPVLEVADSTVLPNPADAWAWAHVQVHRATSGEAETLLATPTPGWADVRSRLVAPTHIQPEHAYLACVVPVYAAGREAGAGKSPDGQGVALAWNPPGAVSIPVYEHWRFRAGPAGDFETLARKLRPAENVPDLGQRRVAVEPVASRLQAPDAPADLFPPKVRAVPTAIAKADMSWPLAPGTDGDDQVGLRPRLKELVDLTAQEATATEPLVGPPLYGRWHALVDSIDGHPEAADLVDPPAAGPQRWIEQLNADPFNRMAAGVATRVVQNDQEPLMASAWDQLDEVLAANRRIRWSQLFAASADRMHARLETLSDARALRLTAPALTRVLLSSGVTVKATMNASVVPPQVLDASFVRLTRYANRSGTTATPTTTSVQLAVNSFRAGSAAITPTRFAQARAVDHDALMGLFTANPQLSEHVQTANAGVSPTELLTKLADSRRLVSELAGRVDVTPPVDVVPAATGEPFIHALDGSAAARHLDDAVAFTRGLLNAGQLQVDANIADQLRAVAGPNARRTFTPEAIQVINQAIGERGGGPQAPPQLDLAAPGFRMTFDPASMRPVRDFTVATGASATEADVLTRTGQLRTATLTTIGLADTSPTTDVYASFVDHDRELVKADADLWKSDIVAISAPPELPQLTAIQPDTAQAVVAALAPVPAYERMLAWAHQVEPAAAALVKQRTPLHPAMAAPHFPDPLVERLRRLDQEWVLGGVRSLPPNSIVLLATNEQFVESFAVGANHELARELVWRGFPTDLRGSCFPRFWPGVPGTSPPADVAPLDGWTLGLGHNEPGGPRPAPLTVVVLKGDLLRRYPSTIVTAELGTTSVDAGTTTFVNDGPVATELFRGFLDPDITYVALNVDIDTLRQFDAATPRHGWYISLRQPLDEPRFGLDEADPSQANVPNDVGDPDNWSWAGLGDGAGHPHLTPASLFAPASSAQVAKGLFQRPFRLLLRAHDYLPAGG